MKLNEFYKNHKIKVNQILKENFEESDKNFLVWKKRFDRFLSKSIKELQKEYLNRLNLKIEIDPNYKFGRKRWLAVYEYSSKMIHQGIIRIGVNYPLFYSGMMRLGADKDLFNIEAQARITVGHEIGHGLYDFITNVLEDYNLIEQLEGSEEEVVEEFGESMFPEATDVYDSELSDVLSEIDLNNYDYLKEDYPWLWKMKK